MGILSIQCRNVRNLDTKPVDFVPGFNILFGENGQGKTNLLEAVYYLGTTKSFRSSAAAEIATHGAADFQITGLVSSKGRTTRLAVHWGAQGLERYRAEKRSLPEEYLPSFSVLAVSSAQMAIINGGPEERRRFLDSGIMGISPRYIKTLSGYNRIRRQRNAMLAKGKTEGLSRSETASLDAWSEQLVHAGCAVMSEREAFLERLKKKHSPSSRGSMAAREH